MTEEKQEVQSQPQAADRDANMWAMFCHLSGLAGFVIPFGNVIAPIIIWSLKKDDFAHVNDQGKEAINFQISVTVYVLISILLIFVAIGILLIIVVGLFALIMTVIAALNANDGKAYRYPFTIRFLK